MMKAFSFLTILESLSKKLSILRTKMHSDNLRVDYESITSQLRVSRPFSRTSFADLSRRASFGLSRRVSHFAAILTILFTIGVGNVFAQGVGMYNLFGYGSKATGGNATPTLVSSESELRAALKKNSVVIITEDITVTSQIKITSDFSNVTLMALPGKKLISNVKQQSNSGILYLKGSNIIIRNVTFVGPGAMDCDGEDLLGFDGVTNAWVDHCDFQDGLDGNFDIKGNSDDITISWCRFHYLKAPTPVNQANKSDDHRYTNLLGSDADDKPDDGTYNITYAYNWWDNGCVERMVRCRNASLHFLNCYWNTNGTASYYIGPENADCYIEGCYFTEITNDHVFHQNFGTNPVNGVTYVNSYYGDGTTDRTAEVLTNISYRTVTSPSYSYPTAMSYTDAQTNVTATCGAGATLAVDETGKIASSCDLSQHTITFNLNGQGNNSTEKVYAGFSLKEPDEPTSNEYAFGGWYTDPSCTNEYDFATEVNSDFTLYAQWLLIGDDCESKYWFVSTDDANTNGLTNWNGFTNTQTGSNDQSSTPTIDGTQYKLTKRTGSTGKGGTILGFEVPSDKAGTLYGYMKSSGSAARTLSLKKGNNVVKTNTDIKDGNWTIVKIDGITPGTYTLSPNDNVQIQMFVLKICETTPVVVGCNSYAFHYGTEGQDNWEEICFESVGAYDEMQITNFTIPSTTHFYVGKPDYDDNNGNRGQNDGPNSNTVTWDNMYLAMSLQDANGGGSPKLGQATGAVGTIRIYANSNWENKQVAFIPNAYKLKFGANEYAFTHTDNTEYRSGLVQYNSNTANNTVSVGMANASGGYVATNHTQEMRHVFLRDNCSWSTDGAKFAIYYWNNNNATSGWSSFMKTVDGETNLYEAWIPSSYTSLKFVRYNPNQSSPGSWDSDKAWNQTGDLEIANTQNLFTMSEFSSGSWSTYTRYGKFRIYDDSWDKNWYVHFMPYYRVTFDANGGSAVSAQEVEAGQNITLPAAPTRTGYTFAGWYTAATGGTKAGNASASYKPTADITLYAQWTANQYTITLNQQEGTGGTASIDATYNAAMPAITLPTRDGYTFGGYFTEENGGGTKYYNANGSSAKNWNITAATTLYAQWTANQYTITLNQQEGTGGTASIDATYNAAMPAITLPTRAGYTFGGYFTEENGGGTKYYNANGSSAKNWNIPEATTLYAKWIEELLTPIVTWDAEENAYAGQKVSVSVTTTSGATLAAGNLTTNSGTLQNVSVNGKTITADLLVPGDASGSITLTLATSAAGSYEASTSTHTITIDDCPSAGCGETVVYSMHLTGQTESSVNGGTAELSSISKTTQTVNSKKYYKFDSSTQITFTPTGGIKAGDVITFDFCGGSSATDGILLYAGETQLQCCTTTVSTSSASELSYKFTSDYTSVYIKRYNAALRFYGATITRTTSGSGSALETNLAWSGDLSSGVSKQVGDANFTYTASSNNSAGAITYSSNATSVATINQTTGEVTIVGAGTTTITATIAASGCYPTKSVTYNLTVTSGSTPSSYTLTYNENKPAKWNDEFAIKNIPDAQTLAGGTGNVYNGNTPVITEAANSDYAIYDFAGWNTAADGKGTSYAKGAAITITENTTLYAQWTPCTYAITYYDTDRTTVLDLEPKNYIYGRGVASLPTPTKDGYTFSSWTKWWNSGEESNVSSISSTTWGDAQLAARWTEDATPGGGDGCTTHVWWHNAADATTNGVTQSNRFTFSSIPDGSSLTEDNKMTIAGKTYTANQRSKSFTGTFTFNVETNATATLYLHINRGGDDRVIHVTQGSTTYEVTLDQNKYATYEISGLTSGKWTVTCCDSKGAAGKSYYFAMLGLYECSSSTPDPDPEPDPNTSTITFDANGGEGSMEAQEFTHGAVAVAISACTYTKENYTFYGWNTKADGTGTPYTDKQKIQLEEDITLYAIWTSAYLTKVLFSNGFDAFIDNTERTVTAYYLAGTDVPTIKTKTGFGTIGDLQDGKITVTGLDDEVVEYDVTLEPVNPNTNTVAEDAEATAFGGSEEWVKAGGGYATDYYILRRQLKNGDAKYDQRVIAGKVRAYFYVGDASKLILTLDGSNKAIKYAIDGGEYTESSLETVTIELNKNNHQIEIISNQQSGDCHIAKYKLVSCIDPVFTVDYEQTSYTQDATASAIVVSVTAGNSSEVNYQWYSNTTNDRSSGSAITGATNASYTPSTTIVGTTYYWCEISNSCSTIKTAAIAITVSAAKSTPTVNWTDPTGEIHYGGSGYSITAEVNDEWNGTLLPSMLTAPAGINIKGVTIADKSITATFDVTATFDRSQEKILFCLTLPETNDYTRLVDEHPVDYVNCATGASESYVINVLEKDNANKYGDYYYWLNTAGWIVPNPYSSCNSETKSTTFGDGQKFEYKHNTNSQTVYVRTFHGGVNKVRIYAEFRNPDMTVTGAYKHTDYFKTQNDTYKLKVSDYTIVYNGDANATSMGESGYKYVDVIFKTPLAVNDIIALTFDKSRVRVQGAVLETESGSSLETSLQWSNSIANEATEEKALSDANFTYTAQQTGENSNSAGAITYSSSNPTVATVNAQTGEVSIEAAGTTTITATLAPSGCYAKATITYTLTVSEQTCTIASGTLTASKTEKNTCEEVTLTIDGYESGATIQWWYNGAAIETTPAGITINNNTLTTMLAGTYSVLVTKDCRVRTNSVTITNTTSTATATPLVSEWYVKAGRLTPPIALLKLEGGAVLDGTSWEKGGESSEAPYESNPIYEENGIVYLTGTPPNTNETEADISYTLNFSITNGCDDSPMMVDPITIVHQKNTDKHVLAFVVGNTEKKDEKYVAIGKGFTESIPASQTTNVSLYNEIAKNFDVQPTNIYSTDDEQKIKEYYSRFDIICITDYPNTKETGVNGKSYTDAMGALIDIRPILSMEAWVSKYPNWNDKGVTGDPKSPTTRQYSMLLQCKDHEIFANTSLVSEIVDGEAMYRVTMVDATKEDYVNLDKVEGDHQEKEGYKYGSNPALQGFTYTSSMSSMLPIGIIDDGAGNNLQVGLERQHEIEARMIVLGVNSYAMERLTADGETVIINALKYLMKKNAKDISDCSTYFVGGDETDPTAWSNENNWGPTKTLPNSSQEARILAPCVVSDYTAKVASVKIVTDGTYAPGYGENGEGFPATGSLTIAPNGALVVKGRIQAATAPNYLETRNTDVTDLIVQSDATGNGALIFNNAAGDTKATVAMYSKAYTNIVDGKKKKHWQYCAIPIHEAPIPEFFWGAYTYLWEEPNGAWTRKRDGATLYEWQPIGVSYGAVMDEQPTYRFYGELTSTDEQSFDLTYTEGTYGGMNLIGNSWTAPINIAAFEDADFEGDVTKEILIHNTGRREEVGPDYNYGTVENTSEKPGQWIAIPIGAPKVPEYDGVKVISSLQAFQINVTAASTLTLNYDRLVRSTKQEDLTTPMRAPSRKAQVATIVPKEVRMLKVRVADKKNHADIYIFDHDGFTLQYDNGWDARFGGIVDNYPSLSVLTQDGEMSMAAIPTIDGTTLGFSSGTDNEYMISFKYTGEETLYLNDMQLKKSTQISNINQYYFTTDVNDMYNRFVISKESFDSPNISTGLANIVTDGNGLQVTNPNQENLQVILIDAAGRLCSIYNTAEPMFNIELPATQGVYMINVKGETTNIVRKVVK